MCLPVENIKKFRLSGCKDISPKLENLNLRRAIRTIHTKANIFPNKRLYKDLRNK